MPETRARTSTSLEPCTWPTASRTIGTRCGATWSTLAGMPAAAGLERGVGPALLASREQDRSEQSGKGRNRSDQAVTAEKRRPRLANAMRGIFSSQFDSNPPF